MCDDLIRFQAPLSMHDCLQLFKYLGGARHGAVGSLDADLIVPGRDVDGQRVANLPQVLVASAEERKQCLRVDHRDGCFCHSGSATAISGRSNREGS